MRGILPACIKNVHKMPLCAACAFAQAHRRNWRGKGDLHHGIRRASETNPGDRTSCDHLVSRQPGLMPQSTGILTHARFWGSVIYVDHFSDYIYSHLIQGTTSSDTLKSKHGYEREAATFGVKIKSYHADNLRFNDNNFMNDCITANQKITFCGVGAHHQNAVVESKIKILTNGARTVLLHAKRKWPKVITTVLWPFALQSVVERHNRLHLDQDGKSPLEKFSQTTEEIVVSDFHTWGCPVFILDAANQSGSIGTAKWDPKSHAGIYLGRSPCHAGSVALVLNLKTGLISPQFHVIFDDEFTTVPYLESDSEPPNWPHLVSSCTERATDEQEDLAYAWLHPDAPSTVSEGAPVGSASEGAPSGQASERASSHPTSQEMRGSDATDATDTSFVNLDTLGLRRSARIANNPKRPVYGLMILALSVFTSNMSKSGAAIARCYQSRVTQYEDFLESNFDGTANRTSPLAQIYLTTTANNEVYNLSEMLKLPDKQEFLKAMHTEVESMFKEKIWVAVPKQEMLDHYRRERLKGKDIKRHQLMMIWSFKRKRKPDGTLTKYKARLCCHGGQQEWGVNYWNTYAPVVSWSSIRILMTLARLNNLYTKSVDFVQAFPQADVKANIYLHNPPGVILADTNGETVLKLLKNLYGLKDAGLTWYEHLTKGLDELGFKPTKSDPCIFIKGQNVVIIYVDDCCIMSPSEGEAMRIYKSFESKGFKVTDEGSMETYLGLQIESHDNSSFTVSQPFLIDRIIQSVRGMEDAKMAKSPAVTTNVLTKDIDGKPRAENWNYRSIIGMLNYLVNCTQPDLAYSVHQCARFCSDPKASHEQAVKRIIRYLLYLRRRKGIGIRYRPNVAKSVETYVDASFAGEWNKAWSDEPSSVMSRTGYVILYAGCPIIWCSKLQTEIALSTTESEYIALSQSLRDVMPLMNLLQELGKMFPSSDVTPKVHCTVFEDNKGCIDLVNVPKMRPRTKHIGLKYHHFREHVRNKTVTVEYIDTKEQIADIFTKAMGEPQFNYLRDKFMI